MIKSFLNMMEGPVHFCDLSFQYGYNFMLIMLVNFIHELFLPTVSMTELHVVVGLVLLLV